MSTKNPDFQSAAIFRYDSEGRAVQSYTPDADTPRAKMLSLLEALDDHLDEGGEDDVSIAIAPGEYSRVNGEYIRTRPDITLVAHRVRVSGGTNDSNENGILLPGSRSKVYGIDVFSPTFAVGYNTGESSPAPMMDVEFYNCRLRGSQDTGWVRKVGDDEARYTFHDCFLDMTHDGFLANAGDGLVRMFGGQVRQNGADGPAAFVCRSPIQAFGTQFRLTHPSGNIGGCFRIRPEDQHQIRLIGCDIFAKSDGAVSEFKLIQSLGDTANRGVEIIGSRIEGEAGFCQLIDCDGTAAKTTRIDASVRLVGNFSAIPTLLLAGSSQAHELVFSGSSNNYNAASGIIGAGGGIRAAGGGFETVANNPLDATADDRPRGYVGRMVQYDDSGTWKYFVCTNAATPTWVELATV